MLYALRGEFSAEGFIDPKLRLSFTNCLESIKTFGIGSLLAESLAVI